MKRFLCFYLSFLLSFNAYSASFPATTTGVGSYPTSCPGYYNNIYHSTLVPPNTPITQSCSSIGTNTGSNTWCTVSASSCSDGRKRYTSYFPMNISCPENSTLSGSTCTPNQGYSSLNTGGTWSVVPSQNINSLCGVLQDYKSSTSTCGYMDSFTSGLSVALTGLGVVIGAIGLIVSAPLVAGVGGAIALLGGVSSISINGNDSDSTTPANGTQPLNVRLSSSAPASGGSSPSVVYDATENKFKPDGSGATGSWSQNGATGEWETTPDSKGTVSKIASNGQSVSTETPVSGGGKVVQTVTKKDDQFEVARTVPQTISYADGSTAQGTVTAAQSFNSSGSATTPKSSHVMPATSSTGSTPVSSSSPSTYTPPAPSTGGTNISVGQCGSVNCESTQVAVLQALTRPHDPSGTPVGVGESLSPEALKSSSMLQAPSGLTGFNNFQMPSHTSECPVLTIPFNGVDRVMNSHCTLADQFRTQLNTIAQIMWLLLAFFIVIGA